MVTDTEHLPHNRTSLSEAVAQRSHTSGAASPGQDPIFPDPLRQTKSDAARIVGLVNDYFRERSASGDGLSQERSKQNTIGFLDASARILYVLGHGRHAQAVDRMREEIEGDRPERADSILASMKVSEVTSA